MSESDLVFSLHIHKQHIHVAAIKYVHECWDNDPKMKKAKTMKQKHNLSYPDSIEVNKESFDHRVIIRCMNICLTETGDGILRSVAE